MSYQTIDDLRSQLGRSPSSGTDRAYAAKMLHQVPDAPVVDRAQFILDHCRGKRVLEFGASGPMHDAIVKVAATVYGVDRSDADGVIGFDLDDVAETLLPPFHTPSVGGSSFGWDARADECVQDFDVIICGEVIEHLSNPGHFLARLRRQFTGVPVVITVPNAFSQAAIRQIGKGVENVNVDHVAWYSFRTLKTLIARAGYTQFWFGWYNGNPFTAEGLVVVVE